MIFIIIIEYVALRITFSTKKNLLRGAIHTGICESTFNFSNVTIFDVEKDACRQASIFIYILRKWEPLLSPEH